MLKRIPDLDWRDIESQLDSQGFAKTPPVLSRAECEELIALYADDNRFRSRIDMARHRFGVGEYKYFADPLPPIVQTLRTEAYPPLAAIANRWAALLGSKAQFPGDLASFLARCAKKGQTRPTPLMLHYEAGGYNCLHQDLYGDEAFPIQLVCALSSRTQYDGGEFLLIEQRPRAQSRGEAITIEQGELVAFPTRERPVEGTRGHYRTVMRHGVSRLQSGSRYTLGIIFHNAK
jgi:hypothetical protein